MPLKAGPTADPEYLQATQLALQEDAALRAADEPPPTEASSPPSAAEMAERLPDVAPVCYLDAAAAPDGRAAARKSRDHELDGWAADRLVALFRDPPVVPAALGRLDLEGLRGLRDLARTQALLLAEATPAAAAPPATWQWLAGRLAGAGSGAAGQGGGWGPVRAALDVFACRSAEAAGAAPAEAAAGCAAHRPGGYGRQPAPAGRGRCARAALPA
jgi:hypothetical protein